MKNKLKALGIKISYVMFITITIIALTSCSKDDKVEEQFSIAFNPNEYETSFYTSGQSSAIEIISNIGNPESINVEANDNVQFDAASGKLSWNVGLPLGTTTATITATKATNQASTQVAINNIFQGDFTGGINGTDENDPVAGNFNISFNTDGTFTMTIGASTTVYSGSYSLNTNNNKINFSYEFGGDFIIYAGVITYTAEMIPFISGDMYQDTISVGNRFGYFEFNWNN